VASIRAVAPDLQVRRVRPAGAGECCVAYWVDDEWIFRFPRDRDASEGLQREAVVMPRLARVLDVPVSVPEIVGTDPRTGLTIAGHRAIHGVPLTPHRMRTLPDAERVAVADRLHDFLEHLHAFPLEMLGVAMPEAGLTRALRCYPEVEAVVFPRLAPRVADACAQMLEAHVDAPRDAWTLVHADLYAQHVLIDPLRGQIVGIIDFGDLSVDDPDADLRTLLDDYGPQLLRTMLRRDPPDVARQRFERARVFCVWDALVWTLEQIRENRGSSPRASIATIARLVGDAASPRPRAYAAAR
jgi:aminoglycoside 2''-phosphotransferase